MSTDLKAIMRRDERRRAMLHDPDLTGDLLLFAFALDEVIAIRKEDGRKRKRPGHWVADVAALVHDPGSVYHQRYWGKRVLESDLPRYEPARARHRCVEPMIRREGLCGKPGVVWVTDRNPVTGEATEGKLLCSRHRAREARFDALDREWRANGQPLPPANTGGVLRRYWSGSWDLIYRWASGREPMEGGREATPPRPTLRLIQGGEMEASDG